MTGSGRADVRWRAQAEEASYNSQAGAEGAEGTEEELQPRAERQTVDPNEQTGFCIQNTVSTPRVNQTKAKQRTAQHKMSPGQ